MLPSPGLEPALFCTGEELVGEPDFRTWRSFEGFTEKAEFFDEEMVPALDNKPGPPDFNDRMGSPGTLLHWTLRKRMFTLTIRVQP